MRRELWLIVLLALFAGAALADYESTAGFEKLWTGTQYNWKLLALLAVLIIIIFDILVYMIGEAFHIESMKRWARSEFLQAGASALIIYAVAFLLYDVSYNVFTYIENSVIGTGSTIVCQGKNFGVYPTGAGSGNFAGAEAGGGPIEAFKCKLQDNIYQLDNAYNRIYRANLADESASASCTILFGIPVRCGSWDMVLHSRVEQAHLLGEKIVPLQIASHTMYVLAVYIANNMLSVFLPLGILLRVFPLLRGVGGLLIAIAIGFYFVFPVMNVMLDPSLVRVTEGRPSAIMQDPDACYPGFAGSVIIINNVLGGGNAAQSGIDYGNEATLLAALTVKIMFYPFVALAITLLFVRSAAPLLGGDTGEMMRMVAKLV